ncbi:MAG: hypothetical protein ACYTGG_04465 [Planctomycetota bacterium]|jgi:hypothetical protein
MSGRIERLLAELPSAQRDARDWMDCASQAGSRQGQGMSAPQKAVAPRAAKAAATTTCTKDTTAAHQHAPHGCRVLPCHVVVVDAPAMIVHTGRERAWLAANAEAERWTRGQRRLVAAVQGARDRHKRQQSIALLERIAGSTGRTESMIEAMLAAGGRK